MVGGVSPKKAGTIHLGLPVFGSVKEVSELSLAMFFSSPGLTSLHALASFVFRVGCREDSA